MPKKIPPQPGPGRPQAFETDVALDLAVRLFWERGYEATSMSDLEARTGLARSSLYNSFGSKRDIYLSSLTRYHDRLADAMFGPIEGGTEGLADLHAFFDRLSGGLGRLLGEGELPGCLIVNSMVEFGGVDPDVAEHGLRLFTRLRKAALGALARAEATGEVEPGKSVTRARLIVMVAIGINVKARAGESAKDLAQLFDAAHDLVESWRVQARPVGVRRKARR